MSILSLTGADGTGKTTLVSELSKQLEYTSRHFDKPADMEDGKNQYFSFIKELNEDENIITDRLHEGEWVYAPLYRNYKADYLREFEQEVINKHGFLQVYVKAELQTIIDRTRKRGEDFVKEEHFQTVLDLFDDFMNEQAMPFIEIDTTNSETENDVKRVIEAFNKVNTIWNLTKNDIPSNVISKPVQPRGNIEAEIMVVGQNPGGKGKGEYSTTWSHGPNSKLVTEATKAAGIFKNCWFTNLVPYPTEDNKITKQNIDDTQHILYAQYELIKPKVIVALGDIVFDNLNTIFGDEVPIISMKHPSYVTRFLSGDKDYISKYALGFEEAKQYL